jgi:type IV secretion system protein VirB10
MRHATHLLTATLLAGVALAGCRDAPPIVGSAVGRASHITLPAGTTLDVTLASLITSETANVGDGWTGTTRNPLMAEGRTLVPAGSPVAGLVTSVTPARKGDRAMLDLGLASVTVDGRSYMVSGTTEAVVAGSTRARNLGAIAGGAAAGALIGQAVSGSTKGTLIGAVLGGGAATGVVSQTRGYQVVLKPGMPITFTTQSPVAVRI